MLKSMTAFGRGLAVSKLGRISVEINSVNRRFLDVHAFLPAELSSFEFDVKKWVGKAVGRGQVTVKVFSSYAEQAPIEVRPNHAYAAQVHQACSQISQNLGFADSESFTIQVLSRSKEVLETEQSGNFEEYRELLRSALEEGLQHLTDAKLGEGAALQQDMMMRLTEIMDQLDLIRTWEPEAVPLMEAKLREKLEQFADIEEENRDRLMREVSLYADKVDISEEITRLSFHLDQMKLMLSSEKLASGKKLDFVLQEINREANTIASKSSDIRIARAVIDIKSELEKIREQVQNVE